MKRTRNAAVCSAPVRASSVIAVCSAPVSAPLRPAPAGELGRASSLRLKRARNAAVAAAAVLSLVSSAFCAALGEQNPAAPRAAKSESLQASGVRICCLQAQNDSHAKAFKALFETVLALKINATRTVKDFLAATDLPKAEYGAVLQGAVEYTPPLIYGDGTCEVRVSLSGAALQANLKAIAEKHHPKEGEFAAPKFDDLPAGPFEKSATSPVVLPAASQSEGATVSDGIPGWEDVSARKRLATEHSALQDALAKVTAQLDKTQIGADMTFGTLQAAKPLVKEAAAKFLRKTLPEAKLYYPKGVVEVRFSTDCASLWAAIEEANKDAAPEQKVEGAVLAAAKDHAKGQVIKAVGYAQLSGNTAGPADAAQTAIALDPGTIRAAALGEGK